MIPIYTPGSPVVLTRDVAQELRMRIIRARHARERGDQEAARAAEQDVLTYASMLLSMSVNMVFYDDRWCAGYGPVIASYTSDHSILEVIS